MGGMVARISTTATGPGDSHADRGHPPPVQTDLGRLGIQRKTRRSMAGARPEADALRMKNLDDLLTDSRFHKVMLGLGVVAVTLVAVWTASPRAILAETSVKPTARPVDLGTLTGQTLSIRVFPGPFGLGYDVLDDSGSLIASFDSEYELIAAFSVPAPSQQLADVPTLDELD